MIVFPNEAPKDGCRHGMTRRDILRVGGSGVLGLSLGSMFGLQAKAQEAKKHGGPGWGKAKHIIMCLPPGRPLATSTSGTPRRTSPTT